MNSLADQLPPEIAKQIHPDWRKNEAEYWANRDTLLAQFMGKWVGFADGVVIASGTSAVDVFHDAMHTGKHPYVTCVGHEDEPTRIRHSTFPYDATNFREPMPMIELEVRPASGKSGVLFDQAILDTGADASTFPWADCQVLRLDPNAGIPGVLAGIGGSGKATILFHVWVQLDGQEYRCRLHGNISGQERILGREVMNRLEILFRGPQQEVVINP